MLNCIETTKVCVLKKINEKKDVKILDYNFWVFMNSMLQFPLVLSASLADN